MNLQPAIDVLKRRMGVNPDSLGATLLPNAIRERMRFLDLADAEAYARRLDSDAAEFGTLADATVVEESWFFRGGAVFAHLAKRIAEDGRTKPFRVLSLPCCTGEEPYSMAIALLEQGVSPDRWHIDAVDLSGRLIAKAVAGLYPEFSFRQTPPDVRVRYFHKEGERWRIDGKARTAVHFHIGNAIDPTLFANVAPYDVVFCRNVLIYLTGEARAQVVANLDRLLAWDGVVCMGHAEPLDDRRFDQREPREFFLYGRHQAVAPPKPRPASVKPAPIRRPAPFARKAAATEVRPKAIPPVDRLEAAKRLADQGDYAAAKDLCRQIESAGDPSADVFHLMGVIALAEGDVGVAADHFRKVLYLQPTHADALTHLMHFHRARGNAGQAALYERRLIRARDGGGV
jgi:chemotaxis protein methyltransferase WspC